MARRILGLDEAGRGSVLGPMVVGAFVFDQARQGELESTGVTDSKLLSPARREALVPVLLALGSGATRSIDPSAIDEGNLTSLEAEVFAAFIDLFRPDVAYIDTPVHPAAIPNFVRSLKERVAVVPELVVEPKADLHYPWVGAASVLAKVERDAAVASLGDVGSGYPSDPRTRALLLDLVARRQPFPPWVRTRWGTIRQLQQQSLFP
jgi:ribonuclease HII